MAGKDVKKALGASLKAEAQRVDERFSRNGLAKAEKAGKGGKGKVAGKGKHGKEQTVRDRFTLPESEYARIGELKERCLQAGLRVKKSELLRAGLRLLARLDQARLKKLLGGAAARTAKKAGT